MVLQHLYKALPDDAGGAKNPYRNFLGHRVASDFTTWLARHCRIAGWGIQIADFLEFS
jgi:hypothetical protein